MKLKLVVCLLLALPSLAGAISCGDTLVNDTVLTENLSCNGLTALTLGAHEMTLDCGGYTVSSDNTINEECIGINGYHNITIKNCVFQNCWRAIQTMNADRLTAYNNTVVNSSNTGFVLSQNNHNITDNVIMDSGGGVSFSGSNGVTVTGNVIQDGDIGLSLSDFVNSTVRNNSIINHNGRGVSLSEVANSTFSFNVLQDNQYGFYLQGLCSSVNIVNNMLTGQQYQGVILASTSSNEPDVGTVIVNNTFDQAYNLRINANANNTLVHHNNFYNGSTYHIRNIPESSQFNTSVGGVAQGNYYDDILDWNITDGGDDGYGDAGSDYPYNASQTKWYTGSPGADYGPVITDEEGGGEDAMVGNATLSSENVTEGSNVNASLQIYSTYNDTFTVRILANGVNRWNKTLNMLAAPGWWTFDFNILSSELTSGDYLLNFTLYNSSGFFIDWNGELLTVTFSGAASLSVNKTVLNEGSIVLNDIVRYLINFSNTGGADLFNVSLVDNYDVDLNYSGASLTPTAVDYASRTVSWANFTNLSTGESYTLYVNFTAIMSAGVVANLVNVTALDESGNTTTASASEMIAIYSRVFSTDLTSGWNLISLPITI